MCLSGDRVEQAPWEGGEQTAFMADVPEQSRDAAAGSQGIDGE